MRLDSVKGSCLVSFVLLAPSTEPGTAKPSAVSTLNLKPQNLTFFIMEKSQTRAKVQGRYHDPPGALRPDSAITSSWPILLHPLSLPGNHFEANPRHSSFPQLLQGVSLKFKDSLRQI